VDPLELKPVRQRVEDDCTDDLVALRGNDGDPSILAVVAPLPLVHRTGIIPELCQKLSDVTLRFAKAVVTLIIVLVASIISELSLRNSMMSSLISPKRREGPTIAIPRGFGPTFLKRSDPSQRSGATGEKKIGRKTFVPLRKHTHEKPARSSKI
jgi:hypothetical protein